MDRRDRVIMVLLAALAVAAIVMGCGLLATEDPVERRDAAVVSAVEDYVAGRISADDCLLLILRAYGEAVRESPDDGWDGLLEILGIAIGTAIPSAGVAVSVVNKRRNASRMLELEERDAKLRSLEAAIEKLRANPESRV